MPDQPIDARNTPAGYHDRVKSSLWPPVALVAIVVAGVVTLSALHVSPSAVTALLPILLAAIAYVIQQLQTVKHQTNGNTSTLLEQIDKLTSLLAQAPAVPPAPVEPVKVDAEGGEA